MSRQIVDTRNICPLCETETTTEVLTPEWHSSPKAINKDFDLQKARNGDWCLCMKSGHGKIFFSASQPEIALWKARLGLYAVIADVYRHAKAGSSPSDIVKLIESKNLDRSLLE